MRTPVLARAALALVHPERYEPEMEPANPAPNTRRPREGHDPALRRGWTLIRPAIAQDKERIA
jgi:hypothetical protein